MRYKFTLFWKHCNANITWSSIETAFPLVGTVYRSTNVDFIYFLFFTLLRVEVIKIDAIQKLSGVEGSNYEHEGKESQTWQQKIVQPSCSRSTSPHPHPPIPILLI